MIAERDWASTSLGPIERWAQVVKTTVGLILQSPVPIVTLWGKDGVMIANAIQAQFGKASNWPLGAALSVTTMIIVSLMAGATVLVFRALQRLAR